MAVWEETSAKSSVMKCWLPKTTRSSSAAFEFYNVNSYRWARAEEAYRKVSISEAS